MFKSLRKAISTPIAIGIILVLAVLVGGFTLWQYQEMQKEELGGEISIPKKDVEDETVNWKIYKNEEYGFEFKYPSDNWSIEKKMTNPSLLYSPSEEIHLVTTRETCNPDYPENPTCGPDWETIIFWTEVYQKPPDKSIREWLTEGLVKSKDCNTPFIEREVGGVSIYGQENCLPKYLTEKESNYIYGLGPQITKEEMYLPMKPSISDKELIGIFNKMLSTFRFIKNGSANWKIYKNEEIGFEIKYPENTSIYDLSEGIRFDADDRECEAPSHECPLFMQIIKLDDTFIKRYFGLDEFKEFKITPEESGWGVDCVQEVKIRDDISAYKIHNWVQARGECYYIFQGKETIIGISRGQIGLGCDSCKDDQLFNQILSTFKFLD